MTHQYNLGTQWFWSQPISPSQNHRHNGALEIETRQREGSRSQEEMTPILPPLVSDREGSVILSSQELQGEIKHHIPLISPC